MNAALLSLNNILVHSERVIMNCACTHHRVGFPGEVTDHAIISAPVTSINI